MCTCTTPNGASPAAIHDNIKKQVRFFDDDKLEERYELEISDQERKAKWMTRADFMAIHHDICRAIQESCVGRTAHNNVEDAEQRCFRGLEAIVSSGRKVQIQAFIQDLLEMQEESRELGISGRGMGLQSFSENHSKSAMERARRMADQDASEARRVYAESLGLSRQ